jgi:hypothetical protein
MQITLFRALQGINTPGVQAAGVVAGLEAHVEAVANNNIKAVEGRMAAMEGKLTGLQASLDALKAQIQFLSIMLGVIGLAIAAGPTVARFIR